MPSVACCTARPRVLLSALLSAHCRSTPAAAAAASLHASASAFAASACRFRLLLPWNLTLAASAAGCSGLSTGILLALLLPTAAGLAPAVLAPAGDLAPADSLAPPVLFLR
jgi:hypothetical protein